MLTNLFFFLRNIIKKLHSPACSNPVKMILLSCYQCRIVIGHYEATACCCCEQGAFKTANKWVPPAPHFLTPAEPFWATASRRDRGFGAFASCESPCVAYMLPSPCLLATCRVFKLNLFRSNHQESSRDDHPKVRPQWPSAIRECLIMLWDGLRN